MDLSSQSKRSHVLLIEWCWQLSFDNFTVWWMVNKQKQVITEISQAAKTFWILKRSKISRKCAGENPIKRHSIEITPIVYHVFQCFSFVGGSGMTTQHILYWIIFQRMIICVGIESRMFKTMFFTWISRISLESRISGIIPPFITCPQGHLFSGKHHFFSTFYRQYFIATTTLPSRSQHSRYQMLCIWKHILGHYCSHYLVQILFDEEREKRTFDSNHNTQCSFVKMKWHGKLKMRRPTQEQVNNILV